MLLNMTRFSKSSNIRDCGDNYVEEIYDTRCLTLFYDAVPLRYPPEERAKNILTYLLLSLDNRVTGVILEVCDMLEPIKDVMHSGTFPRKVDIFIPVVENGKIISYRPF